MIDMKLGTRFLITTRDWFVAPDGESYKAVFGTLHSVRDATDVLGIRTNAKSTNWYIEIGCMIVAGCQVEYIIRTETVSMKPPTAEVHHKGGVYKSTTATSRIYRADHEVAST